MDWCYTLILFCIVMLFPQETQCRSFCDQKRFPIAKVCTDEDVKHIREVYIDTDSVPEFQQTSCECVITPAYQTVPLHLTLYDHSENITSLQFELKDISVGKNNPNNGLNITGATKLLLSAFINHERDGACLAVFSKDGSIFDFSCIASARAAADEEHTESTILVSVVSGACGLLIGVSVAVACVITTRRRKKNNGTHATSKSPTRAIIETDYFMTETPVYNVALICSSETSKVKDLKNVENRENDTGVSTSQYDCINELTNSKTLSENQNNAVSYDNSSCLVAGSINASGTDNTKENQPVYSRMHKEDDAVYDSTKVMIPKPAIGNNEYDHFGSFDLAGQSASYDTLANTKRML